MDRFDAMTAFVAVVDRHGFAPAARHLRLAPSAVTRLVAALEDRLGVRLLQRTTRSLALTEAGARYLERARRILADLDEAEASAGSERGRPAGRFVVSAPAVFGRLHVEPLLAAFLEQHPAVHAQLQLSDRIENLVEDGIDLAVRIGHLADSSLVARRIGATRRVVVAAPAYLAERGAPQGPRDLASHDIIHFRTFEDAPAWRFGQGDAEERVSVAPRFATNSADAAIGQAERGGGLAMVLGYQVADSVRAGRLEIVLAAFEQPALPIHLVYPTSRLLSATVRGFVDLAFQRVDWDFGSQRRYRPLP